MTNKAVNTIIAIVVLLDVALTLGQYLSLTHFGVPLLGAE